MIMTAIQDSRLRTLLTGLDELSATWRDQAGEHRARANRLGNCPRGLEAATEAGELRNCARQLSETVTTALTARDSGPGAELSADDVDALVITAGELWDPDDAGADEALSARQREVLAKVRDICRREGTLS